MKNSHRSRVVRRTDFDRPWGLAMWRKPHVRVRIIKCAICAGTDWMQRSRRRSALRRAARQAWREVINGEG